MTNAEQQVVQCLKVAPAEVLKLAIVQLHDRAIELLDD
jgi:hypothetical protein